MGEEEVTPQARFAELKKVKSGETFVLGNKTFSYVLIGRHPGSNNVTYRSPRPERTLGIELAETTQRETSRIHVLFGRGNDGNFYLHNVSETKLLRFTVSSNNWGKLGPQEFRGFGNDLQVLQRMIIGWGESGQDTHKLSVVEASPPLGGNWSLTFKYISTSAV